MKILYAVQGTGNGHVSRLIEMWPALSQYGEIDILQSGTNCQLNTPIPPKFLAQGFSLFYQNEGGLDMRKMVKQIKPIQWIRDLTFLPIENYDLILSDFEPLSALACRIKGIPFVHIGHQASFASSSVPRPEKKNPIGEWVLKHFCQSHQRIGFHFKSWESWILPPVISSQIRNSEPKDEGHLCIYLPQFSPKEIRKYLVSIQRRPMHVFHPSIENDFIDGHIHWKKTSKDAFQKCLISAHGVITAGGFETPAEALFLNKKLMSIPIQGQYEQQCNAAALKELGVCVVPELNIHFGLLLNRWLKEDNPIEKPIFQTTEQIVNQAMNLAQSFNHPTGAGLAFN
jgi:uncharacterized protein (TIGR00661 family)